MINIRLTVISMFVLVCSQAIAEDAPKHKCPSWDELSPEHKEFAHPLKDHWADIPEYKRERIIKGFERYNNMTPEAKEAFKANIDRFRAMPPEHQERIKQRMMQFKDLPPEEQIKIKQKWNSMSKEEREDARRKFLDQR